MNQGKREPLLMAIERFSRNPNALGQFPENIFLFVPAHLPLRRQPRDPLQKEVIENEDAHFERCRHAHTIYLGQNVARKISLRVEVKQLAYRIMCGSSIEISAKRAERIRAA